MKTILAIILLILVPSLGIAEQSILMIDQYYAEHENSVTEPDVEALEKLLDKALTYKASQEQSAAAWLSLGIIRAGFSKTKGGVGGLSQLKVARFELEKSIELDSSYLNGAAKSLLARLYLSVPGWPLSFGNRKEGVELLNEVLAEYPRNKLATFFLADYLAASKKLDRVEILLNQIKLSALPCECPAWENHVNAEAVKILK